MTTLGICIPTYKRPAFLRRCVESAMTSAQGRPIQVFIADDSVSDTNAEVLADLQQKFPEQVNVHLNPVNLGIDANIQLAVDRCDCDYAWLIGEDDEFLPGAVAAMWEFLQGREDPFVFSSYQYTSEDHSRVLGTVQASGGDQPIRTATFVEDHLWSIGFIGAVVVNRGHWGRTLAQPYLGTYFTHVGRILDMVSSVNEVPVRSSSGVANRAQGDDTFTWKKDSFGVFLGFERMCLLAAQRNAGLAEALSRAATNYRRKFAYFSVKTTFRLRSEGAFDFRQFRTYIAGLGTIETWRKAWLLGLALTPPAALKPFARAYIAWATRRRASAH